MTQPGQVPRVEGLTTLCNDGAVPPVEDPRIPELLTVTQAAARLGMTVQGVHLAIEDGRIKARKIGSVWLLHPDEVTGYRDERASQDEPKDMTARQRAARAREARKRDARQ